MTLAGAPTGSSVAGATAKTGDGLQLCRLP
jgi:hypothetical protein